MNVTCIHLSKNYRELKVIPRDTVVLAPENPETVVSAEFMELIGKTISEIVEHVEISDDINHYNRLRCLQTGFSSNDIIKALWKYKGYLFWMEFLPRCVWKWSSQAPFVVDYELQKIGIIQGNTSDLLNMIGIENMSFSELTKYETDFAQDFEILKIDQ